MSSKQSAGPSSGFSSAGVSTISSGTLSFHAGAPNTFWDNIFDEEDDEDNFEEKKDFSWKDCIIFLIDCQAPMFEENESGEIPFHNAVKCVISTITDKIISSENDVIGVCFYGTDKKKNLNDFENIYVFFDLDSPDAQKILDLEALIEGGFDLGHASKDFPFSDALWTCSTMFSNCPIKVAHKRIFLFTNEDNPNSANTNLREQSFQRAKDLAELGIDIELFSMNKLNERFDFTQFYKNIITVPDDEEGGTSYNFDAAEKFEELKARVRRKEFQKRNIAKLPFYIGGEELAISVKLYTLVQETKKGGYVYLDSKNNQPVKMVTKQVCGDTGTLLMDTQIKQFFDYGREKVIFEKEEIQQIKTVDVAGIKLMGFKPKSSLKLHHNIKHANFIYPDEDTVKGSTTLFAALMDRMLANEKIAIVRLTPRANTPPRFCALVPQEEVLDDDKSQLTPSGFHLVPLPYADDVRALKLDAPPKVEKDQINKAKKLVKTLRIKFDSRNFENPALQKHYADLQALALERNFSEDVVDYVQPDVEGMAKYKEIVDDYRTSVYADGYEYVPKTTPKKSEGKGLKRKSALADIDWVDVCESGAVNKLTVQQLKDFIKCQGLKTPSKAKKENYVKLVTDHVTGGNLKPELLPKFAGDDELGEDGEDKTPKTKAREEDEEEQGHKKKKAKTDDKKDDEPKPTKTTAINNNNTKNSNNNNSNNNNNKPKPKPSKHMNDDSDDDTTKPTKGKHNAAADEDEDDYQVSHNPSYASNNDNDSLNTPSGSYNKSSASLSSKNLNTQGSLQTSKSFTSQSVRDDDDEDEKPKKKVQKSSSSTGSFSGNDSRPMCKYGEKCYRTNPDHLKQFRHPQKGSGGSFSQ